MTNHPITPQKKKKSHHSIPVYCSRTKWKGQNKLQKAQLWREQSREWTVCQFAIKCGNAEQTGGSGTRSMWYTHFDQIDRFFYCVQLFFSSNIANGIVARQRLRSLKQTIGQYKWCLWFDETAIADSGRMGQIHSCFYRIAIGRSGKKTKIQIVLNVNKFNSNLNLAPFLHHTIIGLPMESWDLIGNC